MLCTFSSDSAFGIGAGFSAAAVGINMTNALGISLDFAMMRCVGVVFEYLNSFGSLS